MQLIERGQAVTPERLITSKKQELIEGLIERMGEAADWDVLRAQLPAFVADHEIRLVRAAL